VGVSSAAVGTFNLQETCHSVWSGAGNSQILQYIVMNNYGTLSYVPTGSVGMKLQFSGTFR
jgi:hypothetical protein